MLMSCSCACMESCWVLLVRGDGLNLPYDYRYLAEVLRKSYKITSNQEHPFYVGFPEVKRVMGGCDL